MELLSQSGDNWTTGAIGRAKLQSNHHQQTNIQFFLQAGCPSCRPTNSVKALKGNSLSLLIWFCSVYDKQNTRTTENFS